MTLSPFSSMLMKVPVCLPPKIRPRSLAKMFSQKTKDPYPYQKRERRGEGEIEREVLEFTKLTLPGVSILSFSSCVCSAFGESHCLCRRRQREEAHWLFGSYLSTLDSSFLICKMSTFYRVFVRIKSVKICKVFRLTPDT